MAHLTVYFDASCPLCRREIALYRGRSEADFVDVSDHANVPSDLTYENAMARFHVRDGDHLLSGAKAFSALWRRTPGLRTVGRIAAWPGISQVLELAYRGFLKVRPFVQRRVCAITGEGAPSCR